MNESDDSPLFCHRCGLLLTPGQGNFYVVRIEAVADPSPPRITEADLQADIDAEIDKALDELRGLSEREMMDQVRRALTLHLCGRCYADWIEDPTG